MKAHYRPPSPFTILSLFITVTTAGFISWQLLHWDDSPTSPAMDWKNVELSVSQRGKIPQQPPIALDHFRQHPLFHETRAPIRPSAQQRIADAQVPDVDFEFIGLVLLDGGDGFAFLKAQDSPDLFIVSPGGMVEGWTVEGIEDSELTLSRDRLQKRLQLKSLNGSQPGVP